MNFTEQPPTAGQATITVFLEPENKRLLLPRPRTVQQMLNKLGLRPTACLVIRHPAIEGESVAGQRTVPACGPDSISAALSVHSSAGAAAPNAADPNVVAHDVAGPDTVTLDMAEERRKLRGTLLTHDLALFSGDVITVRKVASHG